MNSDQNVWVGARLARPSFLAVSGPSDLTAITVGGAYKEDGVRTLKSLFHMRALKQFCAYMYVCMNLHIKKIKSCNLKLAL